MPLRSLVRDSGLFAGKPEDAADIPPYSLFLRNPSNLLMLNIMMFTLHTLTSRYVTQLRVKVTLAREEEQDLEFEDPYDLNGPFSQFEQPDLEALVPERDEPEEPEELAEPEEPEPIVQEFIEERHKDQKEAGPSNAAAESEAVEAGRGDDVALPPEEQQQHTAIELFDIAVSEDISKERSYPRKEPKEPKSPTEDKRSKPHTHTPIKAEESGIGEAASGGCLELKSSRLPDLDRLPVLLPQRLGTERTEVTLEDVFLTKKNWNTLWAGEHAQPGFAHSYMANSVRGVQRDYDGMGTCAVVGNSGSLAGFGSRWAKEIDLHTVVIRFNQSPTMAYSHYVGTKTTFRILSPYWTRHYHRSDVKLAADGELKFTAPGNPNRGGYHRSDEELEDEWMQNYAGTFGVVDHDKKKAKGKAAAPYGMAELPLERDASVVCAASTHSSDDCNALHRVLRRDRPDAALLYLMPKPITLVRRLVSRYRARMCASGWGPYDGGQQASIGLVGIVMALQLCSKVSVYGFGPEIGDDGRPTRYHYYSGFGSKSTSSDVISWETEQKLLEALALDGHITWHRGDGILGQAGLIRNNA